MKKLKGSLLLLLTTLLWGLAFVAQSSAAENIGSFTFNTARCVLAAVFMLIVLTSKRGIDYARKKMPKKIRQKTYCRRNNMRYHLVFWYESPAVWHCSLSA